MTYCHKKHRREGYLAYRFGIPKAEGDLAPVGSAENEDEQQDQNRQSGNDMDSEKQELIQASMEDANKRTRELAMRLFISARKLQMTGVQLKDMLKKEHVVLKREHVRRGYSLGRKSV